MDTSIVTLYLFMKDLFNNAVESYKNFDEFLKLDNVFILWKFKGRIKTKYKMFLSDVVLVFKLLDNANLNHQQQ